MINSIFTHEFGARPARVAHARWESHPAWAETDPARIGPAAGNWALYTYSSAAVETPLKESSTGGEIHGLFGGE